MRIAVIALVEIVTILFAAFGGFLTTVAPPPGSNNELSAVGLASLIALIVLAFIKLLLRFMSIDINRNIKPYLWMTGITSLLFIALSLNYFSHISKDTFQYPEYDKDAKVYLAGKSYTNDALRVIESNSNLATSNVELVMTFGGINERHKIWPGSSITENRNELIWKYVSMIIFFCITIGLTIEGFTINLSNSYSS